MEPDKDARMWAMMCHLSALAMYVLPTLGNIIGPLIVWLIKREESSFIDEHGKESLNFQISVTIYSVAISVTGVILMIVCIGPLVFLLLPVLWVLSTILMIIAALKANAGEMYRYPFTLRLIQ